MSAADSEAIPAPVRRTQTERRAEAEQRLLLAARKIVARKGWVGMTLAEVGEEAGYSRGLAAHHFGNKAGLLRALAGFVNTSFMELVDAEVPQRSEGLAVLKGFVSVYLGRRDNEWTNTRALLALMAEAVTEDSETAQVLGEYNRSVQEYLARQVRTGIANGEIRSGIDPLSIAALILGSMRGMMLQYLLDPPAIDLAALQKQLLDFLDSALAP
ncbi:TetR/AcrR family transcriptional regulator [Pseudomonas sp. LS44]|uniref:TetR/AcrR family transcriptional regulator n=1 Tax=Pseudomonas sp. LS44 TaxID=1357074 RepID=UPI00215A1BD7|nr:TetR/AcrR family transcriptional regulator [Pseudomonas sp. LS44]UVE18701.1 TetR/AcrR family transcriptional regulator [Pseudomonas sp. LS44]